MAGTRRGNGEGSITKRADGRWVARLFVQTTKGQKRKSLYGWSRAEAASKLLFSEYLNEWLASKKPELAPDTHRRYTSIVEGHLSFLGSLKLPELRRAHIETLKGRLRRELQPSTTRHVMAVLSSALNQAVAWELIGSNPATHVSRPKDRKAKMRSLSEEEAARLVSVVRDTSREAMYLVALKLGPRAGEIRALRWSDIDTRAGTMTIEHSVATQNSLVWGPTKTGEARTIRLSPGLLRAISEHRERQLKERAAAKRWQDPSLVSPTSEAGSSVIRVCMCSLSATLRPLGSPRRYASTTLGIPQAPLCSGPERRFMSSLRYLVIPTRR